MLDNLNGTVEKVIFHNPENGYTVLKAKIKGKGELFTVVGTTANPAIGENIIADGEWIDDKKYGPQFRALSLNINPPSNISSIEKYLSSGLIKGIRASTVSKLVRAFGKNTLQTLDDRPEELMTVPGLTSRQVKKILEGWKLIRSSRALIEFLCEHGINPAEAIKISRRYGDNALVILRENPYNLVYDVSGFSFSTADRIAKSIGIDLRSPLRLSAALFYILSESQFQGHCGYPKDLLIKETMKLLSTGDRDALEAVLILELESGKLKLENLQNQEIIFASNFHHYESHIAKMLKELVNGELPWGKVKADHALSWVSEQAKIHLSEGQITAFRETLNSKVTIITGGPGVGKTTLLNSLLKVLSESHIRIILAAPTGRAAKRMSDVTEREAKTIHRVLEITALGGEFQRNKDRPLECDLLIIDEMSMVDVPLFYSLLTALPKHAALLMVGDPDQLPSVGPGSVLQDLRTSGVIRCIHLTEVYRQAAESNIVSIAHEINNGSTPKLSGLGKTSDFFFLEATETQNVISLVCDVATRRIPENLGFDAKSDIQVLSPMNKGLIGVRSLNQALQKILNQNPEVSMVQGGYEFGIGDKVMQIKNNYQKDVYNGDIGLITNINQDDETVTVRIEDRDIIYDYNDMDQIVLSYCATIHKSQGSEYPVVIIPVVKEHRVMLQRNLIYTGITRGKKMVILVGDKEALGWAIGNNRAQKRWTLLGKLLKEFEARS